MKKNNVNYPKKHRATKTIVGIHEPVRTTMYDTIMENFKLRNRYTFVHRIVYIGYHSFKRDNGHEDPIVTYFKKVVNNANEDSFCLEKLTGFFIYYTNHFMHLLEGDEHVLTKHLHFLYSSPNIEYLENIKFLALLSHVKERAIPCGWFYYYGVPTKLTAPLDTNDISRLIHRCVVQIKSFINHYQNISCQDILSETHSMMSVETRESLIRLSSDRFPRSSCSVTTNDSYKRDPLRTLLPESERLDVLINSIHTKDLRNYNRLTEDVRQIALYKDNVWPIPGDFVPYDVFEHSISPYTQFPKPGGPVTLPSKVKTDEDSSDENNVELEEMRKIIEKKKRESGDDDLDEGFSSGI